MWVFIFASTISMSSATSLKDRQDFGGLREANEDKNIERMKESTDEDLLYNPGVDDEEFRWHGGVAFPKGYTGPHGDMDNHLNITWTAREKDCIQTFLEEHGGEKVALHDGASCYGATSNESECNSYYELKYRGDHRRGYTDGSKTNLWPDTSTVMGEVHLCEWRSQPWPYDGICEAGGNVKICPAGGHVVETEAAGNTYVGDARRPFTVSDIGVTHANADDRNFCEQGFIHQASPIVLKCTGATDSVSLPNLQASTLFKLGNLPVGTHNLWVNLSSTGDLDMQLRDGSNPEVPLCLAGYGCISGSGWIKPRGSPRVLTGTTFEYENMTIYFSGDEYREHHRDKGDQIIEERIHIDALDATKGSTVPLEVWVNAFGAVDSGMVTYQYSEIKPCTDNELDRTLIKHACQSCSSLVNRCSEGQYAVCDGSSEFTCRDS